MMMTHRGDRVWNLRNGAERVLDKNIHELQKMGHLERNMLKIHSDGPEGYTANQLRAPRWGIPIILAAVVLHVPGRHSPSLRE